VSWGACSSEDVGAGEKKLARSTDVVLRT